MPFELDRSAKLYYSDISKVNPLSAEEERKWILRWKRHQDITARDKVINSNLRFVVTIARKYTKDPDKLVDLIAAGNVGLMNALDRYDVKKKFRFLTYAAWWIAESIHREIYASNPVHVPTHRQKAQRKAAKEFRKAVAKKGPNDASLKKLDPGHPDATAVPIDAINDLVSDNFSKAHTNRHGDKFLRKAIDSLSPREQTVLYLYFGLKDNAKNLGQIARLLDMSPERIRQIKITAIKSLKETLTNIYEIYGVEDVYD